MKIAVTAVEPSLEAQVDERFGRCPYFVIVDPQTMDFEPVANANAALGSGAGIQSASNLADHGVSVVLTGNCGPNAWQTLEAAGIGVIIGCHGRVREMAEAYRDGKLDSASGPNVAGHSGLRSGAGMAQAGVSTWPGGRGGAGGGGSAPSGGGGMGGGGGRGMGGGGGRGMGGGGGRGMGGGGGRGMGGDGDGGRGMGGGRRR